VQRGRGGGVGWGLLSCSQDLHIAVVLQTRPEFESIPATTAAERAVADLLPIAATPADARAALERVPLWFHTFAFPGAGVYTPGIARDHRYRLQAIPEDLRGARVLDVGMFDGFYAFLAERRGAARVVAVDNEQYVSWIASRFGIRLEPGAGFHAIARLLDSRVEYRRLDALELEHLGETFEVVFCFGILHRVEAPLTLLRVLHACLAPGGRIILEAYGVLGEQDAPCVLVHKHGDVYARDDAVYWGFSRASLDRLGRLAGLGGFELLDAPVIAGHPRIIGTLEGG
jgi:tRNA (mo5U34)-methyltransferase